MQCNGLVKDLLKFFANSFIIATPSVLIMLAIPHTLVPPIWHVTGRAFAITHLPLAVIDQINGRLNPVLDLAMPTRARESVWPLHHFQS